MTVPFSLPAHDLPVPVDKGRLSVIVTYMEMAAPPKAPPPPRPRGDIRFMRAESPTVSFYRYLYNTVGEPWLWYDRRRWTDPLLAQIVRDAKDEIHVLYVTGTPAGFIELDRRNAPHSVDISYFGLMPEYIGRGLGSWLLRQGIDLAWQGGTQRLTVNTCTFDHPAALGVYQRQGFSAIRHAVREIPDPRLAGHLPRTAGPHIPIVE